MYDLLARKGLSFSLRMFFVLLIPLGKISVNYHAATNKEI